MIKVVHCKKAPFDIYIGRANEDLPESKWANPFKIGKDDAGTEWSREQVIDLYESWVRKQPELMAALPELRDKVLGCWCKDASGGGPACHGDVLVKLLNEIEPIRGQTKNVIHIDDALDVPSARGPVVPKRDILPLFMTTYSYGQSTLTLEEAGKTKVGNPPSIVDMAVEAGLKQVVIVDERFDALPEAQKVLSKSGIQLIFGLKLTVVPTMADKTPASHTNESSVIIFMKDAAPTKGISPSYTDLIKIHNLAWTVGRYGVGRIDWVSLKRLWTPNLGLALPFFSSFLSRNLLTMATIVPDLPCVPWVFKEVDSHIPFAPFIEQAIDQFAATNEVRIQEVKSVYYRDAAAFKDYQIFRASRTRSKGKSGTYSAPGVDNLSSDRFSFSAWQEVTK